MKIPKKIAICGYNFDKGGITRGSHEGPRLIRERGLVTRLEQLGLDTSDMGDAHSESLGQETLPQFSEREQKILNLRDVFAATKSIYSLVSESLSTGRFPVVLGGDHSMSIGSVAAVSDFYQKQDKKIGLIWIDTHSDINLPQTSPSKRAFGMSVAFLAGLVPGALTSYAKRSPAVNCENISFIGLRDVDPGERELIKKHKISANTIKDIDLKGLQNVVKEAIEVASKGTAGFVVSFDLDVCDPMIVPGTQTPIRGGLNFREAHLLVELLHESGGMLSFELVELNPVLDKDFQTADLSVSLIESSMGSELI